ncbi:hypothetical protein Q5752_005464 [Cryptotrichosporon argae]
MLEGKEWSPFEKFCIVVIKREHTFHNYHIHCIVDGKPAACQVIDNGTIGVNVADDFVDTPHKRKRTGNFPLAFKQMGRVGYGSIQVTLVRSCCNHDDDAPWSKPTQKLLGKSDKDKNKSTTPSFVEKSPALPHDKVQFDLNFLYTTRAALKELNLIKDKAAEQNEAPEEDDATPKNMAADDTSTTGTNMPVDGPEQ